MGDVSLVVDDGTRELSIGFEDGGQFLWLNRFTPLSEDFPFSLDEVQVLFGPGTGVNVGELFDIYFYEDTDGDGDPGTGSVHKGSFQNAAVQAVDDVSWSVYAIPPIAFYGPGDVLIAVVNRTAGTNPGELPAAIDFTVNQGRSWLGTYAGNPPDPPPLPATFLWDNTFGNWMVRGFGVPGVVTPGIGFAPDSMFFMVSPGNSDSLLLTLTNSSSEAIHFMLSDEELVLSSPGGDALWLRENPDRGSIPPAGETSVRIIVDAGDLPPDEYTAHVLIVSDDPFHPDTTMFVMLVVGGAPDIDVDPDSLFFPDPVLVNDSDTASILVHNFGNVDLHLTAVTSPDTVFGTTQPSFSVSPNDSLPVDVVFLPTSPGMFAGILTLLSDDPDEPMVEVYVHGEAVTAAMIALDPDSVSLQVEWGDSLDVIVSINNQGGSDLTWSAQVVPQTGGGHPQALPEVRACKINDVAIPAGPARGQLRSGIPAIEPPGFSVLFDNGPLVNSPGTGAGGADESVLQDVTLGMTNFGFAHQLSSGNRVADDFTVAGNGWEVDSIVLFAYQTFSDTSTTISSVNYRIWDGPPDDEASAVVFGDTVEDRLLSSRWLNVYRVSESTSGMDTDRPVMMNVVNAGVFLPQGEYWLDWQTGGTLASGPWAPPVTINGETTTGDGLQFNGSWTAATDVGWQGFPFIIEGTATGEFIHLLGPVSGTVASGGTGSLTVRLTGVFPDSILRAAIQFISNDPLNQLVLVPVTLTVGNPAGVGGNDRSPSVFRLLQNFPNPFNPETEIGFQISRQGNVKLIVYDLLGREVETLVSGKLDQGEYSIHWSVADRSSGVYFYRLTAGEFVETKKMIVVK